MTTTPTVPDAQRDTPARRWGRRVHAAGMPEFDAGAACTEPGIDPELFHPVSQRDVVHAIAAKFICEGCPIRRECLQWALTHAETGIWGGLTEAERSAAQRRHGLPRRVLWSGAPTTDTDPED